MNVPEYVRGLIESGRYEGCTDLAAAFDEDAENYLAAALKLKAAERREALLPSIRHDVGSAYSNAFKQVRAAREAGHAGEAYPAQAASLASAVQDGAAETVKDQGGAHAESGSHTASGTSLVLPGSDEPWAWVGTWVKEGDLTVALLERGVAWYQGRIDSHQEVIGAYNAARLLIEEAGVDKLRDVPGYQPGTTQRTPALPGATTPA